MKPSYRFSLSKTAALLVMAATLAACGQPEQAPPAAAAPEVGVHTVQTEPLTLVTVLPGRSAAFRIAEVRPQVNGIVEKRLFEEGAEVEKGQQLYQIDDAVHQAEYDRARANLVTTERLAKRYQRLQKTSAISQQQYDDAMAAWKQAQAQAELARINVVYTKVLAPISGRAGRSTVSEGALVTNGQATEMVTVQQIDPIYVDVQQPVTEVLRLRKEMANGRLELAGADQAKASLRLEDGSIYPHAGTLQFSEVTVDPGTSSVTLRAEFPNPDGDLLPGMFV
ncbi:efflux RND transporter periplasmic adaptor subunit [Pusillimonas sp. MFBS29]|uniref:efflux RND transporter periplasmic adaptor subunit n=1 Tax=Pusillimonas sp. MFBS29 TaxID=2886690 RepID=UPI00272DCA36|nr:efflux RND transporter periplasmic adaptor subunit [Pusillimonas sp. MFBS29]